MSYRQVQRLVVIEEEFLAVQGAVNRALEAPSLPNYAHLRRGAQTLEATYVSRLFSEFEGLLRAHLLSFDPQGRPPPRSAYGLINRAAATLRLPNALRDAVQNAREGRNAIVHPDGSPPVQLLFDEARSVLSRFLARLP